MLDGKLRVFFLSSIAFLCIFTGSAQSLSIGVSPGFVDLGEVRPGSTHLIEFFLITDSNTNLVVDMISSPGNPDFFSSSRPRTGYDFNLSEASEEYSHRWVEFIENPVLLPPHKKNFRTKAGRTLLANKRVTVILNIPENAEPGYHSSVIRFKPRSGIQGAGLGIGTIASVEFRIIFRVSGNAVRSGYIAGFGSRRAGGMEVIDVFFKNNGTVTMRVKASDIRIYGNNESDIIARLKTTSEFIRPGQIVALHAYLDTANINPGIYNISARVSWETGDYQDTGEIQIHPPEMETTGAVVAQQAPGVFPFWVISMIILIIFIGIYWWKK